MSRGRGAAAAVALILAAAVAGCGLGSGSAVEGEATLTVTRDFGAETILEATVADPPESETVARFLDREAEIETSYGGNFIDAIEGTEGELRDGRRSDWFFFVNGYWSPVGAAEARVRPDDRIWWDHRDWEAAYRVPAVVGSWPQPFLSGSDGGRQSARVVCEADPTLCGEVSDRLEDAGADLGGGDRGAGGEELRVLVGDWGRLGADDAAALLEGGPEASGVYAEFERAGGAWELVALDERGREHRRLGAGAGLVAAVQLGDREPTWLVTGTDAAGVAAAAELLEAEGLGQRYAVAAPGAGEALALPAGAGEGAR